MCVCVCVQNDQAIYQSINISTFFLTEISSYSLKDKYRVNIQTNWILGSKNKQQRPISSTAGNYTCAKSNYSCKCLMYYILILSYINRTVSFFLNDINKKEWPPFCEPVASNRHFGETTFIGITYNYFYPLCIQTLIIEQ